MTYEIDKKLAEGTYTNVFICKDLPKDTIFMAKAFGDIHAGDLVHNVTDRKTYVATETGRLQSVTPNIENIPKRDAWEAEHLWAKCREEQRLKTEEHRWALCDTCHERFRCWTACHPENPFEELQFKTNELSKAIAMNGLTMAKFTEVMNQMINGMK